MATVEYGRLIGPLGFARAVAIKRLHAQFARDPDLVSMFIDEARVCSRLSHSNVIPTLDIVEGPGELALIMEYVHGEALCDLLDLARARGELVPVRVATALLSAALHGLHAAHEAKNERGESLAIVHRDVSPQNILVGADGVPRVFDFGIAKAIDRLRSTPSGEIKGKLAYIAPEQLCGGDVDRRTDVYGASSVLWEVLTGRQLFDGPNASAVLRAVMEQPVPRPSAERPELPAALDRIVLTGLSRDAAQRFATAREMALALEREIGSATQSELSEWLQHLAGDRLAARASRLQTMLERAAPAAAKPDWRRLRVSRGVLALAVAAIALVTVLVIASRRDDAYVAYPRPAGVLSSPAPTPTLAPVVPSGIGFTPTAAPGAAAVHAGTADPGRAPASAEVAPGPVDVATPATIPAASEQPVSKSAGRRPAGTCTPPYVVDRIGVRHPKPECL